MRYRIGVALGAILAATCCATASAKFTAPGWAGPVTQPSAAGLDFDQYFPGTIRIHVGDSVNWTVNGFHTITFSAPGSSRSPRVTPLPSTPVSGQLDATGHPFFFNGQPSLLVNPVAAFPAGD